MITLSPYHVKCSIICNTHPPCLQLCRFRGGGFDQGNDDGRFNSLLLRLLGTGEAKRCQGINTIPGPGREERWRKHGRQKERGDAHSKQYNKLCCNASGFSYVFLNLYTVCLFKVPKLTNNNEWIIAATLH